MAYCGILISLIITNKNGRGPGETHACRCKELFSPVTASYKTLTTRNTRQLTKIKHLEADELAFTWNCECLVNISEFETSTKLTNYRPSEVTKLLPPGGCSGLTDVNNLRKK